MEGRFCSLDQTHSACESTLVENYLIPSPKLSEEQSNTSHHRESGQFWPKLVGYIRAGWTFSSDNPTLISRWGTLTLDGGTRPIASLYNLSTAYKL